MGLRMVRGGASRVETVMKAALMAHKTFDRPGLSIFAADLDDADLVRAAAQALPHMTLRFGWVRCLVEAGFDVEQTGRPPHHTVWLPDVNTATLRSFLDCFEPPVSVATAGR